MGAKECIAGGRAVLGIEFGSTRIKAVLVDENNQPIASGAHDWENRLENGIWTYSLEDIWSGLQDCYREAGRGCAGAVRREADKTRGHRVQRHDARVYGV